MGLINNSLKDKCEDLSRGMDKKANEKKRRCLVGAMAERKMAAHPPHVLSVEDTRLSWLFTGVVHREPGEAARRPRKWGEEKSAPERRSRCGARETAEARDRRRQRRQTAGERAEGGFPVILSFPSSRLFRPIWGNPGPSSPWCSGVGRAHSNSIIARKHIHQKIGPN